MIELKRILFPTDFSENSKVAQVYACELAEHFKSELHILHVLPELSYLPPDPNSFFAMPPVNMQEMRQSAERALAGLPGDAKSASLRVVRTVYIGPPFVEIVRYAREHQIDLIVVGTHGRTGLAHVLLGSVAENVVRKAGCPVLTIRPTDHKFVMP